MPHGRINFEAGKGWPIVKYRNSVVICAKTAERIEMPLGLWTWVMGRRKHKFTRWCQCALMGGHIGATWRIRLNRLSVAAMRPFTLTTCF